MFVSVLNTFGVVGSKKKVDKHNPERIQSPVND